MKPLLDILEKYRRRLIVLTLFALLISAAAFFATPGLIDSLCEIPGRENVYQTKIAEAFMARLFLAVICGAAAGLLGLLYSFLAMAKSRKSLIITLAAAFLFAGGAVFCRFVLLPSTVHMLIRLLPFRPHLAILDYIIFCTLMMTVTGLIFEEPLVIRVLFRLGLVNREILRRARKPVYITALIVMAVITPSGDAVTLVFAILPFIVLYETALLWTGTQKESGG